MEQTVLEQLHECAEKNRSGRFSMLLEESVCVDVIGSETRKDSPKKGSNNGREQRSLLMAQRLIAYLEDQLERQMPGVTKASIIDFLNTPDQFGFTALHLAAFNGDLESVEFLKSKGANIAAKNYTGLSVMHAAAQGDSPLILQYFKQLGFSIDEPDDEEKTPLFWSVFADSEYSTAFLLSWGANVNKMEKIEGQTALHRVSNSKIARKLLMAGADRSIRDKKGKLPHESAELRGLPHIAKMLNSNFSVSEFCNLRTPLAPPRQKRRTMLVLLFLNSTVILSTFFIIISEMDSDKYLGLSLAFYIFGVIQIVLLVAACLKEPGYCQTKKGRPDLLQLLSKHRKDFSQICPDCHIVRPLRSKHCYICGHCVSVYDHHCPWINNCVGAKNIFVFFLFLSALWLSLLFLLFLNIYFIAAEPQLFFTNDSNSKSTLGIFSTICCFYNLVILSLFLIPVSILWLVQVQNICSGLTQLERYSHIQRHKVNEEATQIERVRNLFFYHKHNQRTIVQNIFLNKIQNLFVKEMEESSQSSSDSPYIPSQLGEEDSQHGTSFISERRDSLQKETLTQKRQPIKRSILLNCAEIFFRNSKNPRFTQEPIH